MAKKMEAPKEIVVTIGNERYELKCSRSARKTIDNLIGGIGPALQAVQDYNFERMAALVIAGSGMKPTTGRIDRIADALWSEMDHDQLGKITEFAVRMTHGGRPEPADGDEPGESETAEGNA